MATGRLGAQRACHQGRARAAANGRIDLRTPAKKSWRITDRNSGPIGGSGGSEPATNQDTRFVPLDVTCAGTPSDNTVGSSCDLQTTANAVIPGTIQAGERMIGDIRSG